jgi:hypothetical protein
VKKVYKSYFSHDPDPGWSWPVEISERFQAHSVFEMSAGYYFEPESAEHSAFLALADRLRLDIFAQDLVRVSGKEVSDYPYYRLNGKVDKEYEKPEYMDWQSRCAGDEQTMCRVGGRQHTKIVFDPARSKSLDIMELPEQINPHIYIISKRLKDSLHEHGFTGFRTVPCLESQNRFSQSDLALEDSSAELEARANKFQLIVTARPEHPPHVRRIRIRRRCTSCGTVYLFFGGGTPYFERGEPADTDFQVYHSYQSENEGTFDIAGRVCVVSTRFIQLMEENRFTGLELYSKTPPIPYGVVPIH